MRRGSSRIRGASPWIGAIVWSPWTLGIIGCRCLSSDDRLAAYPRLGIPAAAGVSELAADARPLWGPRVADCAARNALAERARAGAQRGRDRDSSVRADAGGADPRQRAAAADQQEPRS